MDDDRRKPREPGKRAAAQRRRGTDRRQPATAKDVPANTPGPSGPSASDVAVRAYELYERRGGEPGHAVDDWLEAERQIAAEQRARQS